MKAGARKLILVGLGKRKGYQLDTVRGAAARALRMTELADLAAAVRRRRSR